MIFALDTNIVAFWLKEDKCVKRHTDTVLDEGHIFVIPKIVDYEVRRGLIARNMTNKLQEYLNFRKSVLVGAIDDAVWEKAIEIYVVLKQIGRPIGGDGDILIASFCLVNGYTLVTDNTKHFEHIQGLSRHSRQTHNIFIVIK